MNRFRINSVLDPVLNILRTSSTNSGYAKTLGV